MQFVRWAEQDDGGSGENTARSRSQRLLQTVQVGEFSGKLSPGDLHGLLHESVGAPWLSEAHAAVEQIHQSQLKQVRHNCLEIGSFAIGFPFVFWRSKRQVHCSYERSMPSVDAGFGGVFGVRIHLNPSLTEGEFCGQVLLYGSAYSL